jgi:ribosomal protein S18 acetylase RimI-like enzyme
MTIRTLTDGDAETFVELRREALLDWPLAFASSPDDDLVSSAERVRDQLRLGPDSVIFGAFQQGLVGSVGLYRDRHVKSSHKAHLWGMYVLPSHRRQGIASRLLDAVLGHAAALPGVSWVELSVSSATPEAQRLYERAGFRLWGTEPDALRHEGRAVVLHHMALRVEVAR